MRHHIFLPGWSGSDALWQEQDQALKDIVKSQVFTLTEETTIQQMAEQVLKKSPQTFILVGHSLGGWVSQKIASMAPHRVEKLILLDTWTGDSSEETRHYFKDLHTYIKNNTLFNALEELRRANISPSLSNNPAVFELFRKTQESFPIQGYINQTKALLDSPPMTKAELAKIQCPTLVVKGQDDTSFTMEQQMEMVNGIPHAKFTLVPNSGHMIMIERPEAVSALVRLWVNI